MGHFKPKGMDKYWYIDEKDERWKIKDDAPEWAKKEFKEFYNREADENGIITIS